MDAFRLMISHELMLLLHPVVILVYLLTDLPTYIKQKKIGLEVGFCIG
jgi:hypothetical protein